MKWAEVRVDCHPLAEEAVSAVLTEVCGGVSVSPGSAVRGWLPVADQLEARLEEICSRVDSIDLENSASLPRITISQVDGSEWDLSWRKFFSSFECGNRFRIRPPWEDADPEGGLVDLIIDPGMAFGTGQHPTTELMLQFLSEHPPAGLRVLDMGSGSAILGIAAARLGASEVVAVEVDLSAAENARRNIDLNMVQDTVTYLVRDGLGEGQGVFQMAMMNILADVIIRLAPTLGDALDPGALLACSGIIETRLQDVLVCLREAGYVETDVRSSGEWRAIICAKPR